MAGQQTFFGNNFPQDIRAEPQYMRSQEKDNSFHLWKLPAPRHGQKETRSAQNSQSGGTTEQGFCAFGAEAPPQAPSIL
jgi:hypothetical protein